MSLIKSKNIFRISPSDWQDNYLSNKIKAGENVTISVENGTCGEEFVVSANKTQGRKVKNLNADGVVEADDYLVLVDASQNHVVVTLPPARDFLGNLSIVCIDASYGIELAINNSTANVIFDTSAISFNAKGDSVTLVSDRGFSKPEDVELSDLELSALSVADVPTPGTWFVVGVYHSLWYA